MPRIAKTKATPTQALLEVRLGGSLADYISGLRSEGLSWRAAAEQLHERTGIQVTGAALCLWFGPKLNRGKEQSEIAS